MNSLRLAFIITSLLTISIFSTAQTNLLKKSWIAVYVEEFRQTNEPQSDTAYIRYIFGNGNVLVGMEPAWHMIELPYSVDKKKLTMGFSDWKIEELTDSTLTIFQAGFRRMKFIPEEPFRNDPAFLIQIGEHNGKPLYKANQVITPRYKKPNHLTLDIKTPGDSGDYNTRAGGILLLTFIITETGKIEDPKVIKGLNKAHSDDYVKGLLKTSKTLGPRNLSRQARTNTHGPRGKVCCYKHRSPLVTPCCIPPFSLRPDAGLFFETKILGARPFGVS
jgi:hypothetical protein